MVLLAVSAGPAAVLGAPRHGSSAAKAAAKTGGAPSLRNGLRGDAYTAHRKIRVTGPSLDLLEAELTAAAAGRGLAHHMHWLAGGALEAIVPPDAWAGVMAALAGRERTEYEVVHRDYQAHLEAEKAQRAAHPFVKVPGRPRPHTPVRTPPPA